MDDRADERAASVADLTSIRGEIRFELGLLHDRVNALVAAGAFLTIAYTSAMGGAAPWATAFAAVVPPVLAVLGLLLAVLAWPGISATAKILRAWTARRTELLEHDHALEASVRGTVLHGRGGRRVDPDQWRSMLFFRAVPVLFALVRAVLGVVALVLTR